MGLRRGKGLRIIFFWTLAGMAYVGVVPQEGVKPKKFSGIVVGGVR
jgi:hypothetical protein